MSQFQVPVGERCARMLEEKEIVSSSDLFDCKIPTVAREEITFFLEPPVTVLSAVNLNSEMRQSALTQSFRYLICAICERICA
jgi:hypothetical protein